MNPPTPGYNYVYLLTAEREPGRLAIGVAPNLAVALAQHNAGEVPTTAGPRPWVIHLALGFRHSATAEKFERYLRTSSGRAFAKRHFLVS